MDNRNIFFSYSKVDANEFALKMANDLRMAGANIWIDQLDIHPSQRWDLEIQKALKASDCIIFIVSEAAVSSDNVLDELNYALNNKKRVIPVIIDACEIPYRISRLQHIDFMGNYEKGLATLLKTLQLEPGKKTGDVKTPPISNQKETKYTDISKRSDEEVLGKKTINKPSGWVYGNSRKYFLIAGSLVIAGIVVWAIAVYQKQVTTLGTNDSENSASSKIVENGLSYNKDVNSPDFRLRVDKVNSFKYKDFSIDQLNLNKDFVLKFKVQSYRIGGSTRYGIAWNFNNGRDFLLFTLHTINFGYYTIGPGNNPKYRSWSRFKEGAIFLNGENAPDELQIKKIGEDLVFSINDTEVWRTSTPKLNTTHFAFWVADTSEAALLSYSVMP